MKPRTLRTTPAAEAPRALGPLELLHCRGGGRYDGTWPWPPIIGVPEPPPDYDPVPVPAPFPLP